MNSFIIVDTQLQIINVIELIKLKKLGINHLVIGSILPHRIAPIKKLLENEKIRSQFAHVYFTHFILSNSRFSLIFNTIYRHILIYFLVRSHKKIEVSIIGNYLMPTHRYFQYLCEHFLKVLFQFVVDDGTITIKNSLIRNDELSKKRTRIEFNSRISHILYYFLKKVNFYPKRIIYFSVYEIKCSETDYLIFNSYIYLKGLQFMHMDIKPCALIIIGQSFVRENIMKLSDYLFYLNYIIEINPNRVIYYFPHPAENYENYQLPPSIVTAKTIYPIELSLLNLPKDVKIFGLNSSALYNLKKLTTDGEVNAVVIDAKDILINSEILVNELIYSNFKKAGINLIYPIKIKKS